MPGREQIHMHMLGIGKDRAYLNDFYKAKTMEDKAAVVDNYAREHLDMTADIDIMDNDRKYYPLHPESPLSKSSVKSLMNVTMLGFCVKTACVTFVINFAYGITKRMFLGRAVLDLEMRRLTTAKMHPACLHMRNLRL